jgi:ABC-type iron transport system FetAB ATPase subunit
MASMLVMPLLLPVSPSESVADAETVLMAGPSGNVQSKLPAPVAGLSSPIPGASTSIAATLLPSTCASRRSATTTAA